MIREVINLDFDHVPCVVVEYRTMMLLQRVRDTSRVSAERCALCCNLLINEAEACSWEYTGPRIGGYRVYFEGSCIPDEEMPAYNLPQRAFAAYKKETEQ